MSTVLPPSVADFDGVLSETRRILRVHPRHFLSLSALFLLPVPFFILVLLRLPTSSFPLAIPLKTLAFLLASSLFFLSAVTSITFSAFHGRSVNLTSALSSISCNFLPLLATSTAPLLCIAVVVSSFSIYKFLAWKAISLIDGGAAATNSPYFLAISAIGALISALVLTNFIANWFLVGAVVVIENRWGFDALTRSKDLVSGMRWTAVSLVLLFGIAAGFYTWLEADYFAINGHGNWWWDWSCAALIVLILLHSIVASTVLYVYCKVVRGELEDEFAGEYACLPNRIPPLV